MTNKVYHYTECGLDNVYLDSGFQYVEDPDGRCVAFQDIDGLHQAIGDALVNHKENLTGKEVRFLRTEMLMSQVKLAKLLQVSEQAVHRWENGKSALPKPAEQLIRLLYREHINDKSKLSIRAGLEHDANLEDAIDDAERLMLQKPASDGWQVESTKAA